MLLQSRSMSVALNCVAPVKDVVALNCVASVKVSVCSIELRCFSHGASL